MCGICGVSRHGRPVASRRAGGRSGHDGDARASWTGRRRILQPEAGRVRTSPAGHHRSLGWPPADGERGRLLLIVFNGEIYNHRELQRLLESKGHRFVSSCDTKYILHAYEEFGRACVDGCEGMFAVRYLRRAPAELSPRAIASGKSRFSTPSSMARFTSRASSPALTDWPLWRGEVDLSALEGLTLGYFLAPSTIYRDVHKLPPGHWLRLADGAVHVQQYWDVPNSTMSHIGRNSSSSPRSTSGFARRSTNASRVKSPLEHS